MPAQQSPSGKIVSAAVVEFPKASHSSLARKLYAEHPNAWPNLDACRQMVRAYRGRHGAERRREPSPQSTQAVWHTPEQCEARSNNPFRSPPSAAAKWEPRVLASGTALVLGDVHLPYHDERALEAAVNWGAAHNPSVLVLLGDFIDCHRLSKFQPDPDARKFGEEIEAAKAMIRALKAALPGAKVIYKLGNHDERLENYINAKAPELLDVQEFTWQSLLRGLGVTVIDRKRLLTAGKLTLIHGHEYGSGGVSSPVNPARGLFLRAKACALCAHQHQSSSHDETTIEGRQIGTWSLGCLCDLHPQYRPLNKWGHGFALVSFDAGTGWFEVQNRKIIKGRVV